jgi:hypothetical protein
MITAFVLIGGDKSPDESAATPAKSGIAMMHWVAGKGGSRNM